MGSGLTNVKAGFAERPQTGVSDQARPRNIDEDIMAPNRSRNMAVWPTVIAAAVVILLAVWFFMGVDVEDPVPTPDSPAATNTDGEPVGTTGPEPQPGTPPGVD